MEIDQLAPVILSAIATDRIVLLQGEMGAGKTTLVQTLAVALGCRDIVTSPTFTLVQAYEGSDGTLYHADLHRLETPEQAWQIGLQEILDSGHWCFVEWPDLAAPLLPDTGVTRLVISKLNAPDRRQVQLFR